MIWSKPSLTNVFACAYDRKTETYKGFEAFLRPSLPGNIPSRSSQETLFIIRTYYYDYGIANNLNISNYEKIILLAAKGDYGDYYTDRESICANMEKYKNKLYAMSPRT